MVQTTGVIRRSVTQSGTNRKKVGEQQTTEFIFCLDVNVCVVCSTDVKKQLPSLTSEALLTLKEREREREEEGRKEKTDILLRAAVSVFMSRGAWSLKVTQSSAAMLAVCGRLANRTGR